MSSSQEAGFDVLDEVFEHFRPVDVDAFIDSQFARALGVEEEISCSIPLVKGEGCYASSKTTTQELQAKDAQAVLN